MEISPMFAALVAERRPRPAPEPVEWNAHTRTAKMRESLRAGPLDSAELAALHGCDRSLVYGLLQYDVKKGRVFWDGCYYSINRDYDDKTAKQITQAVKLLRRHGYTVNKPQPLSA